MTDHTPIKKAAIISIVFSAIHIIGAVIIIAAPAKAIEIMYGYKPDIVTDMPLFIPIYLYIFAFILNIIADILIIKRISVYAPFIISLISAISVFTFANIIGRIQTIIYAHLSGLNTMVFYGEVIDVNDILFLITFAGLVISISLSAVYLYLRKKEQTEEYHSSGKGYAIAAIVLISVYVILLLTIILGQKQLMIYIDAPDILLNVGFHFPAKSIFMLLVCAFDMICCAMIIKRKSVFKYSPFAVAVIYPIARLIIQLVESRISDSNVFAYNGTLYSYENFFTVFISIGVIMCSAASEVYAYAKKNCSEAEETTEVGETYGTPDY